MALQAAAADEAAQAHGLRVLRWRSREVDLDRVTNADYRALLTGASVLAQGIEEFKGEIRRALVDRAKVAAPSIAPAPTEAPYVYVNAEAVDRDLGLQVLEALAGFGAISALPPLVASRDSPDQIRRAQQDQLETCDGVVLIYGQAPAGWV
ncbi:MAG TPA: hypothetical protein VN851_17240, partial [Thermoanaerobaculia bacterium]|nr:hypothetical protein [Thermoanaerobaculia bacterium]